MEKVCDKRVTNGTPQYLIKWFGYDMSEATWEVRLTLPFFGVCS